MEGAYALLVGQRAVDEEVGRLEKVRFLGQLLDGVAAVHQEATVAVDEGDLGRDGGGVEKGGIEDADAIRRVVEVDFGNGSGGSRCWRWCWFKSLEGGGGNAVVRNGDHDALAGAVVGDCHRLLRRSQLELLLAGEGSSS